MPAIVGVAAHVADRLGGGLGQRRGLVDRRVVERRRRPGRRRPPATSSGVGATAARAMRADVQRRFAVVERHRDADADDGDVHLVARDEAQVARRRSSASAAGSASATSNSPRPSTVLPGRGAELLDRHARACPSGPAMTHTACQRDQRRDRVGGRRGVAQVAADAGPALDLDAADQRRRRRSGPGYALAIVGVLVDAVAGHGGADAQPLLGSKRQLVELGDVLDVDEQRRRRGGPRGPAR